jgi:serine/threonine-protein kinase
MPTQDLFRRLAEEGRVDVQSALADFARATRSDDPDRFLSYLHERRMISDALFCDLHEGGGITVAKLVGVQQRTLLLETPKKTLILPANQPTLVPAENGNSAPEVVEPSTGRSRYSLLGCLGKGAMGEVHVARDEDLLRKVAYKRMVPEVAQSRALAARFFSEIQVTAQLDHPNIVPIYGLEVAADNALGYSMKLVQGQTLAHLIEAARGQKGDATLGQRLEIFLKVCDAMAYAHSKGVLHRDLKP